MTVPEKFNVKMSANSTGVKTVNGKKEYQFKSQIKIPSYLIALAVGDLQRVSLGSRVGLIAEP